MAELTIGTTALGNSLQSILNIDSLQPGDAPSYQICKTIYSYHPLGAKLVDKPIELAQSQQRQIAIKNDPDDRIAKEFQDEWKRLGADRHIANVMRLSRIYGAASVVYLVEGVAPNVPVAPEKLADAAISFNVLDPLNTSGSLVLNQNPNALDFQKQTGVSVAGVPYHRSRSCVILNEEPIYIEFTTSAFGYVGRSVFQRTLFPLKSYLNLMVANDMVAQKLGFLIAKQKQSGSIVDRVMQGSSAIKRGMIQQGRTNNVLTIDKDEEIETLNMMNVDGAGGYARKNILHDIAAGASMPAKLVNDETFAEGFGEGTEDAKEVAQYIDKVRESMAPLYDYFTFIVQYRAWNERFYEALKAEYPEKFEGKPYKTAFFEWVNSFTATWPNLLVEPESELAKSEKVVLDALNETAALLLPVLDPENKAALVQWVQDNLNDKKLLFKSPLVLYTKALEEYDPSVMAAGAGEDDGE